MKKIMMGIQVSEGIAIGRPLIFKKKQFNITEEIAISYEIESQIIKDAFAKAEEQILNLKEKAIKKAGQEEGDIFEAHLMMLRDPMMRESIDKGLKKNQSAAKAVEDTKNKLMEMFKNIPDSYIQERAADIKDITERLLRIILREEEEDLSQISEPVILIAEDLSPSETVGLSDQVKGIIVETGGRTSHAAILAKALEIPALVGATDAIEQAKDAQMMIMDTIEGKIIVNPTEEELQVYEKKQQRYELEKQQRMIYATQKAVTKDGYPIKVYANIGSLEEWEVAKKYGANGIGLFRTEFLYMQNHHFPTEEEQFSVYKKIAEEGGEEIIIRTLDIGGDKNLAYYKFKEEMNPFLGNRAIRFTLSHIDVFKTQLKAILRAALHGNLKLMYPMISSLEELYQANQCLEQCKVELKEAQIPYKEDLSVGIMIEIPGAAIIANELIKEVDFFSIGTNDLCQYTLAVDRMNPAVSHLYIPHHPSILRLIKQVSQAANEHHKIVGVCGEMAGDPLYTKLLLGLGINELSMSSSSIPKVKEIIINNSYTECQNFAREIEKISETKAIEKKLKEDMGC